MKDYLFLFRQPDYDYHQYTPEEMKILAKNWADWIGAIAAQNRLSSSGHRLAIEGKVLRADGLLTDGPFVEIKEMLGGFIIVKARSLQEAALLAENCPATTAGGSVEIRAIAS